MNQLTQKERMLLQDEKAHEEICIQKYGSYAVQVQDQQLRQMFDKHRSDEVQHHQTLTNILGQGGQSAGGQAAGGQAQSGQGSPSGGAAFQWNAANVGQAGQAGVNQDVMLCKDLVVTETFVSGAYDTAIFQVTDPQIRQTLEHIQKDEHQHGADLSGYLKQQGISG